MRIKIIQYFNRRRLFALLSLISLILVSLSHPLAVRAQSVTQGYNYEGTAQRGMVMSLAANDPNKVELATHENSSRIHGVVVDPNDSPVTISNENQKVFVATVGKFDVMVSDQNGQIAPGDFVTISSIAGVAMKADENQNVAIGKAATSFNDSSGVVSTIELKDDLGGSKAVKVGRIMLDIGIGANPLAKPKKADLPEFIEKMASKIADKPVSSTRVYIGLVVLVVASIVSGSLLYGGVRSSIISIGRNPLSKKSIIRGLIQVIMTSLMIFIIGVFGVYLLIKL